MGGVDPRAVEQAWRAAYFARRAAHQARRAARQAARAAAHRERLLADSPEELADLHARVAAIDRRSEACQRTADGLLSSFARRLERWAAREDAAPALRPVLMREVARTAGWGGVVLSLRDRAGEELLVAASDPTARRVHEVGVALAEGPAVEAGQGRTSIAHGVELQRRWPRFGKAAWELGVRAAAAVPLDVVRTQTPASLSAIGPPMPALRGHQRDDLSADLRGLRTAAEALDQGVLRSLTLTSDADADPTGLELFEPEDLQLVLHRAAGMLHERHGWDVDDATALVRAHAYAEDRPVVDVAADVVSGRLFRF